uniref:Synaptonemal complex central element protein 2 n=1 Tax=Balaenoptera musculus TaxID=9771 RepID=A0A8C0CMB6_BALMU
RKKYKNTLMIPPPRNLTEKLEERMYQIYNHHNKIIQEKLQEFTQKMAKISHLETELKEVCHTVETVYKDLCGQPECLTGFIYYITSRVVTSNCGPTLWAQTCRLFIILSFPLTLLQRPA